MSEIDLEKVRKNHVAYKRNRRPRRLCSICQQRWPCDAIQLADEVERLRKDLKYIRNHCPNCRQIARAALKEKP